MSDCDITREQFHAYLDDALTDVETARIERALRGSESARQLFQIVRSERDRGEHSVGGIWRAERLSCPTREQLSNYTLDALAPAEQEYIRFHLTTIGCLVCLANIDDIKSLNDSNDSETRQRRHRIFASSAGMLPQPTTTPKPNGPPPKS